MRPGLLVLVVLGAGCDYMFRLDEIVTDGGQIDGPIENDGPANTACVPALIDDFVAEAPCQPWSVGRTNNGATMVEMNGLVVTLFAGWPNASADCFSTNPMTFTKAGVLVNLATVPGPGAYMSLTVHGGGAAEVEMVVAGGQLSLGNPVGTPKYHSDPYDPGTMQWVRLRSSNQGQVEGMYSQDGQAWTSFGIAPVNPPPEVSIELVAGTVGTKSVNSVATFKHFVVCQ